MKVHELMEALTLVQTGKTRKMPIILVCSEFWGGMVDWLKQSLIGEGMIAPEDMAVFGLDLASNSPSLI